MRIGIDASRAFLRRRTGIEEYSYQAIRHLRDELRDENVILYVRAKLDFRNGRVGFVLPEIDFELPERWRARGLFAPRFWTQLRLSFEMFTAPVDVLFVPAHTVPLIHPDRTIVTIHGLEYEFSPESYGFWERLYMRWSIRYSVRAASQAIAVSENTKRDLVHFYGVPASKIAVIHEGVDQSEIPRDGAAVESDRRTPYFFFIGRIETRKNIIRMIEAFERFKANTGQLHQLLLAGKPGYGYEKIEHQKQQSQYRADIIELGYITESEKWTYLKRAEAFLFPSLYEGFGLPVIEAQVVRTPVITSRTSSLPEIAGEGAILVDPLSAAELSEAMEELVRNPKKRADIIEKATRNADRFSWAACARALSQLLKSSSPS